MLPGHRQETVKVEFPAASGFKLKPLAGSSPTKRGKKKRMENRGEKGTRGGRAGVPPGGTGFPSLLRSSAVTGGAKGGASLGTGDVPGGRRKDQGFIQRNGHVNCRSKNSLQRAMFSKEQP